MHLVKVPIVLGRGVRICDGLEGLDDTLDIEAASSSERCHRSDVPAQAVT
jgi:hypothetical protein